MKWKTERLPLLHGTLANTDHIYAIKSQFVYTRSFANTFSRPTHEMLWKYYFNVDTLKLCWVAGKLTGRNRKLYILKKGIIYSHFASKFVLQTKPKRLPYRKIFEHEHRKRPNKLISISTGIVTFRRITTRTLFNLLLFFFCCQFSDWQLLHLKGWEKCFFGNQVCGIFTSAKNCTAIILKIFHDLKVSFENMKSSFPE